MLTPIGQFHSGLAERLGLAGDVSPDAGSSALAQASGQALGQSQAKRQALKAEATASGGERNLVQQFGSSLESFDQAAKQIVGQAVDVLRDDFGGVLEDMGFDGEAAKALLSSLLQPLQQALESGADFTAQVSMLAVQQQTAVSGNSFSQELHLVAKSLEIEVNHSTGELSIGLTSLSIEQSVSGSFGAPGFGAPGFGTPGFGTPGLGFADGAAPLLPLGGDSAGADLFGADLADFIEDLLERVEAPESDDDAVDPLLDDGEFLEALEVEGEEHDEGGPAETAPDGTTVADEQAVRVESRTRFTIQAVERFENDLGQAITRLRIDASVRLAALAELPVRDDAGSLESGQRGAGARVLDLKI